MISIQIDSKPLTKCIKDTAHNLAIRNPFTQNNKVVTAFKTLVEAGFLDQEDVDIAIEAMNE